MRSCRSTEKNPSTGPRGIRRHFAPCGRCPARPALAYARWQRYVGLRLRKTRRSPSTGRANDLAGAFAPHAGLSGCRVCQVHSLCRAAAEGRARRRRKRERKAAYRFIGSIAACRGSVAPAWTTQRHQCFFPISRQSKTAHRPMGSFSVLFQRMSLASRVLRGLNSSDVSSSLVRYSPFSQ